jgi:hypothetical protein
MGRNSDDFELAFNWLITREGLSNSKRAWCHGLRARVLLSKGDRVGSLNECDTAIELLDRREAVFVGCDVERSSITDLRVTLLLRSGDSAGAVRQLRALLEIEQSCDAATRTATYLRLASTHRKRGEYAELDQVVQEALPVATAADKPEAVGTLLLHKVNARRDHGLPADAREAALEALLNESILQASQSTSVLATYVAACSTLQSEASIRDKEAIERGARDWEARRDRLLASKQSDITSVMPLLNLVVDAARTWEPEIRQRAAPGLAAAFSHVRLWVQGDTAREDELQRIMDSVRDWSDDREFLANLRARR